ATFSNIPLVEGDNNITATQTDIAGNQSPQSPVLVVSLDTVNPVITSVNSFNVNENNLIVSTLTATDISTPLIYAITVDDNNSFDINSSTGVLTFTNNPDFENSTDSNNDNNYTITITVTDNAGNVSTQVISIIVTDINEAPIATYTTDITMNENNTTTVTLTGTDPDGDAITFIIDTNVTDGNLTLNTTSGVLTYTPDTNFTGVDSFRYTVNDGNLTSLTQEINITVNDIPEFNIVIPELFESKSFLIISDQYNMTSLDSGDLNGDNKIDLIISRNNNPTDVQIRWHENLDNNGSFQEHNISLSNNYRPVKTIIYNLDSDGDNDIITAIKNQNTILWHENNGTGNFTELNVTTNENGVSDIFVTDINDDNYTDIISISESDNRLTIFTNDGNQNFTQNVIVSTSINPKGIFVTDIKGDGDSHFDIIIGNSNQILIYENNGSEDFSTVHTVVSTQTDIQDIFAIDIDDDNDTDIISASKDNDSIYWYENNGAMSFTEHNITESLNGANTVYATDFDKDGDIDIMATALAGKTVLWYQNNGNEIFTPYISNDNTDAPIAVTTTDIDGDGDLDMISASENESNITWYESTLPYLEVAGGTTTVIDINATDLDGDTISYSNIGGADTALFNIDSGTGLLKFVSPAPVFSTPSDSDSNNIYEVQIQIDDGKGGTNSRIIKTLVTP
ncbi:MAG: Unknown protein, partial [uncultured Campylobacterales bacterium]